MAINTLNLYSASKQEILNHANYLQQFFEESNIALGKRTPVDQVNYYNDFQNSNDALLIKDLRTLQLRVAETYKKTKSAIPNISKEELETISGALEDAENELSYFLANKSLAATISDLYPIIKNVFSDRGNVDPDTLNLYKKKVEQLKSDDNINNGNWEAVKEMMSISGVPEFVDSPRNVDEEEEQELLNQIMALKATKNPEDQNKLQRIKAALNMALKATKNPEDQNKLQRIKAILNEDTLSSNNEPPTRSSPIEELQNLLPFQDGANSTVAEQRLEEIECGGIESQTILESIYFHLYYIHKIETPRTLKNDSNYGKNAMIGTYPATNTERRRAIMRTIVDLAMQELEDAVVSDQIGDAKEALKTLESLHMDAKDMPQGQNNLAHILFGQMYHKHVEARKRNSSLIDPHHGQFQGDFGRNSFKITTGIDPAVKIAAIDALRQTLKKAWKIII